MAPREEPNGGRFRVLVVGAQAGGFGLLRARKRTSSGSSKRTLEAALLRLSAKRLLRSKRLLQA
jgi:hypothetical protein